MWHLGPPCVEHLQTLILSRLIAYLANEVLDDLALDINERRNILGILSRQMGQQALEVEGHVALAGLGLESVLIGHDEFVQTIYYLHEDVGGDNTIAQDFLSPLCPHGGASFRLLTLSCLYGMLFGSDCRGAAANAEEGD